MNVAIIAKLLARLPPRKIKACVLEMPTTWIEQHIAELPIKFKDIFYQRTWSLDFLETQLRPEDVDMWDHISIWYSLTEEFCEANIEWLNFHDLYYSQGDLSAEFYKKHSARIDWIPNTTMD
jgi:hypothetical protein